MSALVDAVQRSAQVGEADGADHPSWLCRSMRGDRRIRTLSVVPERRMCYKRNTARQLALKHTY
jgi:hypothetical protein